MLWFSSNSKPIKSWRLLNLKLLVVYCLIVSFTPFHRNCQADQITENTVLNNLTRMNYFTGEIFIAVRKIYN